MNTEPFCSLDVSTLVVQKPHANASAGKSSYIDRNQEHLPKFFIQRDCRILWPVRPGNVDGTVKKFERLNLEVSISPQDEEKARECDEKFLDAVYDMKVEFFGESKAKKLTSRDSIKPMYKNLLREGGVNTKDGGNYANSIRMKVDGWSDHIEKVNITEKTKSDGEKIKLVKDFSWNDRVVDSDSRNAPTDKDTHFYLYLGLNPSTGKPRYTDRVACLDSNNKPIQIGEINGKPLYKMRYVSPFDATPGSTATVVWSLSKLYLTESFGPTCIAKDVYIKPLMKKATSRVLDDVEIDTSANANDSVAVLSAMREEVVEEAELHHELPTQPSSSSFSAPTDSGKKRKHESSSGSSKKKSNVVEEDF